MSKLIKKNKLQIRLIIIGEFNGKKNNNIKVLGKYKREDLPEIIENNHIDIVFISSICAETFSYTTHEAKAMDLKVACFDIGAQAECVRSYSKGLIIKEIDAQVALNAIINFIKK